MNGAQTRTPTGFLEFCLGPSGAARPEWVSARLRKGLWGRGYDRGPSCALEAHPYRRGPASAAGAHTSTLKDGDVGRLGAPLVK